MKIRIKKSDYPRRERRWVKSRRYGYIYLLGYVITIKL